MVYLAWAPSFLLCLHNFLTLSRVKAKDQFETFLTSLRTSHVDLISILWISPTLTSLPPTLIANSSWWLVVPSIHRRNISGYKAGRNTYSLLHRALETHSSIRLPSLNNLDMNISYGLTMSPPNPYGEVFTPEPQDVTAFETAYLQN